jgi:hypothetical protein
VERESKPTKVTLESPLSRELLPYYRRWLPVQACHKRTKMVKNSIASKLKENSKPGVERQEAPALQGARGAVWTGEMGMSSQQQCLKASRVIRGISHAISQMALYKACQGHFHRGTRNPGPPSRRPNREVQEITVQ